MNKASTESANANAVTQELAQAVQQPEQEGIGELVRRHPAAFIAGGVILGLVAGALLPRGTGRRVAKGAVTAAVAAGQAGIHLSHSARDTAEELTREGREVIERNAIVAQRRAAELAEAARDKGSRLAGQAAEFAARVRQ